MTGQAHLAQWASVHGDRDALAPIMADLHVPISELKAAVGWLTEKAGCFKPNGHLLSRSPFSHLLEAESTLLGVWGKAACWRTLRMLADVNKRLAVDRLDALLQRAEQQSATLEELLGSSYPNAASPARPHAVTSHPSEAGSRPVEAREG